MARKKKLNYKLTLVNISWYNRIFRYIINVIRHLNLDGKHMRWPNQFIQLWAGRIEVKDNSLKAKLDDIIKQERKIVIKHFKEESYGLDLDYIQSDIINRALGFNIDDYITAKLIKGLKLDVLDRDDKKLIVRIK